MSSRAISVENVSKAYRLGVIGGGTLQGDFARWWARVRRRPDPLLRVGSPAATGKSGQVVWALRDVCLTVEPGEVVGIIGRNGAGKSTLLKILSRVTAPSMGTVRMKGRVGSLLEVGTGFHPELTGRENIFLNGAMLGMRKAEIRSRLEEIVEFAEVGEYLDTPVKRYSSGMYVRLAFAVAAHLEPEILIVDEVLAVGDAGFQSKCLGKMDQVAKHGRAILFVSHNMGSVQQLCPRVVRLADGRLVQDGPAAEVIKSYLGEFASCASLSARFEPVASRPGAVLGMAVRPSREGGGEAIDITDGIEVVIDYRLKTDMSGVNLAVAFSRDGTPVFVSFDTDGQPELAGRRAAGDYTAKMSLPPRFLKAGRYVVTVGLGRPNVGILDEKPDAIAFDIEEVGLDTTSKGFAGVRAGCVIAPAEWTTNRA